MSKEDLDRLSRIIISLYSLARSNGYPSDLVSLHSEAQTTYNFYALERRELDHEEAEAVNYIEI